MDDDGTRVVGAPGDVGGGRAGRARGGLHRLRRPRLYEQLADHITAFIDAQGLSPGERLPPERLLAEQLGVSRATLAQALVALEVRGVVDVRHGDGAVLREDRAARHARVREALDAPGTTAPDLAEAVVAAVAGLVDLAAGRATAADRAELAALADDADVDLGDLARALAAAASSPVLAELVAALAPDGGAAALGARPRDVVRAVAAGDTAGARAALRDRARPAP
ncbi:FadR/GntR family transcriptional regulator [Pseudokineococcus lusitanus]|uniref:GntR family transcriptional regulator n=1 Tax=Pseudokineococcus lusitanus TaxID=763993 RepID=A0A3N1HL14_9ACTN|nr:GntR family transcriptional regulator [Pseudokineococcus lusitanus]ROP43155.1 GntR family transcriptional regulator [Pseudokineococcus lusitanus]